MTHKSFNRLEILQRILDALISSTKSKKESWEQYIKKVQHRTYSLVILNWEKIYDLFADYNLLFLQFESSSLHSINNNWKKGRGVPVCNNLFIYLQIGWLNE